MKSLRILMLGLFFLIHLGLLFAQDAETEKDGWKKTGSVGLNFSQTSLTNWSAGGNSSMAGNIFLKVGMNLKKSKWLWQNNLNLEYGLATLKDDGVQKTTDNIALSSQIGYQINESWYYSGAINYQSQFYKGYNYPDKTHYISKFMAPGYLYTSLGVEYKPKNSWYQVLLSPVTSRMTFVLDDYLSDLGSFGVDEGKKFKNEIGAYVKGKAEKTIWENVKLVTDAYFFTPYTKDFGNVDIEWNVLINMKINKFLNASVNTALKYQDKVKSVNKDGVVKGPKIQFKEVIGIGIGYNF